MKTIFTNCSGREVLGNQHSGPVLGRDPFLAVVSQDHGGGTILSGDEFLRRLKCAEGTQHRLVGNHDEWMRRTNDMLTKRSGEHTELYVASFSPVELHLCSDGLAFRWLFLDSVPSSVNAFSLLRHRCSSDFSVGFWP